MKRKKKFLYSLLLLTIIFIELFLYTHRNKNSSDDFITYTNSLWKSWILEDTLSMHYTIANPETYGIFDYEVKLPIYEKNERSLLPMEIENQLNSLSAFDYEMLNADQKLTYNILIKYLETQLIGSQYLYYDEPLSPSSGAQSQLPILLAEYTFWTKQDIEDYLTLLSCVDDYFIGITSYEQEKSAAGLFMSEASALKIVEQCDFIMDKDDIENRSHFLQLTFQERIDSLISQDIITKKEANFYIEKNNTLLNQVLAPAYEQLADAIFLLKDTSTQSDGLFYDPNGANYYNYLLKKNTGSSKTPEELMVLLTRTFSNEYSKLINLSKNLLSQENESFLTSTPVFSITDPDEMLTHLQQQMSKDFPPFKISESAPNHVIKEVNSSLENFVAPAFYLTPPIDNISKNSIYINYKDNPDSLSLYTTLGHEGYPGHLYQTVYHQLVSSSINRSPIRNTLYYGGYTEGWAFYVENMCYSYASDLVSNKDYCEFYRLDRNVQLCLFSMLDLSIHYYGMNYEQTKEVLVDFGISDEDTIRNLYEYIVDEPTTYLKYYVGYLEMLECKQLAKEQWKQQYSDLSFHKFVLDLGPCDFDTLKKCIKEAFVSDITKAINR